MQPNHLGLFLESRRKPENLEKSQADIEKNLQNSTQILNWAQDQNQDPKVLSQQYDLVHHPATHNSTNHKVQT